MDIVVFIKPVPLTEEIKIADTGLTVDKEDMKFFINETDTYALEEAVLKKEKFGGTVTVVTLAEESIESYVNDMIWESYAKGADTGIFIATPEMTLDSYSKSQIFSEFLKTRKFDLILLGVQSSDTSNSILGSLLANQLHLPYTTMVSKLDIEQKRAKLKREMEEGYQEIIEIPIPAVLTIQTGINTPRYPPFVKIRNAKSMPITKIPLSKLISDPEKLIRIKRTKAFIPESKGAAKVIKGDPEKVAEELSKIIKTLGVS
jgi:electron transfer flavoprotein beta subunit